MTETKINDEHIEKIVDDLLREIQTFDRNLMGKKYTNYEVSVDGEEYVIAPVDPSPSAHRLCRTTYKDLKKSVIVLSEEISLRRFKTSESWKSASRLILSGRTETDDGYSVSPPLVEVNEVIHSFDQYAEVVDPRWTKKWLRIAQDLTYQAQSEEPKKAAYEQTNIPELEKENTMSTLASPSEIMITAKTMEEFSDLSFSALDVTVIPQTGETNTAPFVITNSPELTDRDLSVSNDDRREFVVVTNVSHEGMFGGTLVTVAEKLTPKGKTSRITGSDDSERFSFDEFNDEKRVISAEQFKEIALCVERVSSVSKHSVILFSTKQEGIIAAYGISEISEDITNIL